jgi:hypothetical protein
VGWQRPLPPGVQVPGTTGQQAPRPGQVDALQRELDRLRRQAGVGTLEMRGNAGKFVRVDAQEQAFELADAPTGGGGVAANNSIEVTAGEALGGDRAVFVSTADGKAYYADKSAAACRTLCGLTTGAAALGALVTVQTDGVVENIAWAWAGTDPVFLGATGLLSQTPPASGYVMQVGVPVGSTKLRIEPQLVAVI